MVEGKVTPGAVNENNAGVIAERQCEVYVSGYWVPNPLEFVCGMNVMFNYFKVLLIQFVNRFRG